MSTTGSALNRSWRFFAALEDIVQEVREWGRRTEKVALTFMALFRDEELCLRFGELRFDGVDDAKSRDDFTAHGGHGARGLVSAVSFDDVAV